MKKLWILALSLLMMVGCVGRVKQAEAPDPASPKLTHEQVIKHAGESTVALIHPEDGRIITYCSAVWVSETQILTAAHCVDGLAEHLTEKRWLEANKDTKEGDPEVEVEEVSPFEVAYHYTVEREVTGVGKEPGAMHLAKLKKVDRAHDLALIVADKHGLPTHEVAEIADEVVLGEHVVCVGHPAGLYWSYLDGTVSAASRESLPRIFKAGPFIQVNASIWMGNSGGGAFDHEGKLLGIASFLYRVPNQAFYIHRNSIVKFLYPPVATTK